MSGALPGLKTMDASIRRVGSIFHPSPPTVLWSIMPFAIPSQYLQRQLGRRRMSDQKPEPSTLRSF